MDAARPVSEAQILLAEATVQRQETVNAISDQGTRQASILHEENTRIAVSLQQTRVRLTDTSQQVAWTSTAVLQQTRANETAVSRRETKQSAESATRIAQQIATATVRAIEHQTAQSQDKQTATAYAHYPTATAEAVLENNEFIRLQQQRQLELEKFQYERSALGWRVFFEMTLPPLVGFSTVLLCVYGAFIVLRALDRRERMKQVQYIKTLDGVTRGYLSTETLKYHSFEIVDAEPIEAEGEPDAPVLLTDGQDRKLLNAPDPMIDGFIHRVDLSVFIKLALQEQNWTQTRWLGAKLPRGFCLSNDTKDSSGKIIHGGYSRLLQRLVDYHLVINRKRGRAGDWNPNAPTDFQSVMAILTNDSPKPDLPSEQTALISNYTDNIPVAA